MTSRQHERQNAVILPFPLHRIRRPRPPHQPADSASGGKVVFLVPRLPLRVLASEGGLPPAA
jgi:hypothetical protein